MQTGLAGDEAETKSARALKASLKNSAFTSEVIGIHPFQDFTQGQS